MSKVNPETGELLPFGLTWMQYSFCVEYPAAGGVATEAAARAGYKGSRRNLSIRGAELLKNPRIQKCIASLTSESAGNAPADIMTSEEVLKAITKEARECKNDASRVAALKLLGTYHGLLIDRFKDETSMSDEEIAAELARLEAKENGAALTDGERV